MVPSLTSNNGVKEAARLQLNMRAEPTWSPSRNKYGGVNQSVLNGVCRYGYNLWKPLLDGLAKDPECFRKCMEPFRPYRDLVDKMIQMGVWDKALVAKPVETRVCENFLKIFYFGFALAGTEEEKEVGFPYPSFVFIQKTGTCQSA